MKSIYTISPMVYRDKLPDKGEISYVISEYFFLFKVYHESKDMIIMYMNYMDRWYENAFSDLCLKIIQFDYPDHIAYSSGAMADYINNHYNLSGMSEIDIDYELIVQSEKHYIFGNLDVMFNGVTRGEVAQASLGLFEDDSLSDAVMIIARYLTIDLRKLLCNLVKVLYDYDEAFQELDQTDYYHYDIFDNPYIDSNYAIYYELRKFIEIERRTS